MYKLLISIFLSVLSSQVMAIDICKPKLQKQSLTYHTSKNTPVYFAGFIIELPPPQTMGLFGDNVVFKYGPEKTIYLTYSTPMLSDGRDADYDPVAVFKQAFNLQPLQEQNIAEVKAIIRLERLCENALIQYQINGINDLVIRTTGQNGDNNNTVDTFILSPSKYVYMLGFKGFTNQEIDQLLSTIHKPIKK